MPHKALSTWTYLNLKSQCMRSERATIYGVESRRQIRYITGEVEVDSKSTVPGEADTTGHVMDDLLSTSEMNPQMMVGNSHTGANELVTFTSDFPWDTDHFEVRYQGTKATVRRTLRNIGAWEAIE